MREIDLVGKRIYRLTVLKEEPRRYYRNGRYNRLFLVRCDCGNEKVVFFSALTRKNATRSCGCYWSEVISKAKTKHGKAGTRLYHIWAHMKARCRNGNDPRFKDYGGRGIRLFDGWKEFKPFQKWALKNGYRDDLTIERRDVNGNYEPKNCLWIPFNEQAANKRTNIKITHDGKTLCLKQWSRETGIIYGTLTGRYRKGFPVEKMFKKEDFRSTKNNLQVRALPSSLRDAGGTSMSEKEAGQVGVKCEL